ncbi:HAMP domain-containing sensor histidine kinase [Clostridium perfringens]|uniref:sensor histidine kinase n=1 Tax=Clostridium perfringens TaxID=1502 RepID=UPI00291401A9|nr:HAMP domain-containing sensor histidine kinase [Clostridium perfringens]EJT6170266.1 HAMP domain-containing histidine kinase [Clostridium perfringens]EJT6540990.1 HAMP domain-containing histidine kinase [Clostridium perfringens]EJT6565997.1 HAMP domain-containing histidine kinase [Clostridium perfringens]MBS5993449.1 HAMP domain-containing histidine kinase [Clostridium perfringens]MDM0996092.1 HAMP domain-containing sensor histidine kinase [Clostridium perfringens]
MECTENDYMYLKLSKVRKLISIFIWVTIILYTVYFFSPHIAINLSKGIETVLIFAITFIATTIFKFSNKKIFKLISICLLIVALLRFNTLIYLIAYFEEKEILEYLTLKPISLCIVLESIYCFMVIAYVKAIDLNIKITVCFFTVISLISVFLDNIYVFWIFSILLFSIILYVLRDFKLCKNNSLNHLKLLVLTNLVLIALDFLTYRLGLEIIILLNYIMKIWLYFLIYVWISDMLIRKPYETLNQDIIDENRKLEILNKRMEESNNEFKEFKKNLRDKENYFKNFLDNVPMSMVILNSNNYRVFTVNKRFMNEFNLKNKRDIINKNLFKILDIKNKEEFLITKKCEASFVDCGIEVFFELDILLNSNDYLIISMKNVTELKCAEKIKDNLRKRTLAEQIKNDFLSSISHDLKTPINVIYSSVQVQEKFYSEQNIKKVDYYNQVNKENCMTLMRLANNLIDSSKIDYDYLKPNLKIYNIVTLIEDSIGNVAEYIKEKNLTYVFDTNEEEVYVKCDQEFIQRIILNLISNSIKHTREGGIGVEIKAKKNKVLISFTDTGEGMDKEFLERAFLRYSKGNKKGVKNKSTGIGLYIVKNLVELQNGTIKINSIKDTGTNIRLEFNREKRCGI